MRHVSVLWLALAVAGLGCAGTAEPPNRHLLRAPAVERAGAVEAPVRVVLGTVRVAPYLDRAGLVVEVAPGQVRAARRDQWAEPLASAVRAYLRDALGAALGFDVGDTGLGGEAGDLRVDVYLDRLHGDMRGQAWIDAVYRIAGAHGEAVEYRFARSQPLPRAGYAGLVEAESALLDALARDVAAALRPQLAP